MAAYNDGHGATVTFATGGTNAGKTFTIPDLTLPAEEGEIIDTSHLGTSTHRTKELGALLNQGEVTLTVIMDLAQIPVLSDDETVTITLPLLSGESTAGTFEFSGGISAWNPGSIESNARISGEVTLFVSGDVTVTPGS